MIELSHEESSFSWRANDILCPLDSIFQQWCVDSETEAHFSAQALL